MLNVVTPVFNQWVSFALLSIVLSSLCVFVLELLTSSIWSLSVCLPLWFHLLLFLILSINGKLKESLLELVIIFWFAVEFMSGDAKNPQHAVLQPMYVTTASLISVFCIKEHIFKQHQQQQQHLHKNMNSNHRNTYEYTMKFSRRKRKIHDHQSLCSFSFSLSGHLRKIVLQIAFQHHHHPASLIQSNIFK